MREAPRSHHPAHCNLHFIARPLVLEPCRRNHHRQTSLDVTRVLEVTMLKFLLWMILFVLCWPLALLALILWPIVWLLTLPFRIVGIAVDGMFGVLRGVVLLPARLLGGAK
jgi:hypothetical protein